MGSSQSNPSLKDYQIERNGLNCSIVTKNTDNTSKQTYFLKTFNTSQREVHQSRLNFFRGYQQKMRDNQEMTCLIDVLEEKSETFCSSCFKTHLIYEYSPITVHSQISQRRRPNHTLGKSINPVQNSQFFKLQDLSNILYSCLSALWQIKEQAPDSPHHEIKRFQTIFISTKDIIILQDGALKVTDPYLYNYENRYTFNSKQGYSPQKISDFYMVDDEKSAIYELGLTMLEIALLTEIKNTISGVYDETIIREKLEQGKNLYREELDDIVGVHFFDIISNMVQTNRQKRFSLAQVIEYAEEMYDQQIQQSNMNNFSEKPHQTVETSKKQEHNQTNHSSNAHTRSPSLTKFKQQHKITTMSPKISNFIIEQAEPQSQQQSSMLQSLNVQNPASKIHAFNSSITGQGIFKNVTLNDSYTYDLGRNNHLFRQKFKNKQNQEQLFTDPLLLMTIRRQLQEIQRRKGQKMRRSTLTDGSMVVERKIRHEIAQNQKISRISNEVYLTQ